MAMRSKHMLIVAGILLSGAVACAPVDPGFGEAVRYDMAIQTIDPDPVYPEDGMKPGSHGEKAQKATDRYRKGTTKPVQQQTSSGN